MGRDRLPGYNVLRLDIERMYQQVQMNGTISNFAYAEVIGRTFKITEQRD